MADYSENDAGQAREIAANLLEGREASDRDFEAGFSIEQVTLVTGHRDWKMLRRYTHLKPEGLRKTHPQNGASLAATAARASSG